MSGKIIKSCFLRVIMNFYTNNNAKLSAIKKIISRTVAKTKRLRIITHHNDSCVLKIFATRDYGVIFYFRIDNNLIN